MKAHQLTVVDGKAVENKLVRMKDLAQKLKVLEAEYNMLKGEVIEEHFSNNEEYKTEKGLVLATYKSQEQTQFQQSKFKADHFDIYSLYTEKKTINKFLLK